MAELADDAKLPEERVRELLALIETPISLETPVGDGESLYGDLIEDARAAAPLELTADKARADGARRGARDARAAAPGAS